MEDIPVTCSKLENKLYTLKHQEKGKQITILEFKKKFVLILKMTAISELYFKQLMEK
jgi:hypothetical protein